MPSFQLLFLALVVVSVCGYDLNTRQQYLPVQTYPAQNGYSVVYTTTSQLPLRAYNLPTHPTYLYPANYVIPRQTYYTPYTYQYQPKDITPKIPYPVRGSAIQQGGGVPSVYEGQMYSPSYPYRASESSQQITYPVVYSTTQQESTSPMQTYSSSYPYQTKENSPKVLFPFRGYAAEQQNARTREEQEYIYQTKEALPKVTLPVGRYQIQQENTPLRQEQAYPSQMKRAIQKITYPVQEYPEGFANMHRYPSVFAARYPDYQTVNQGYPTKQEDVTKRLLSNKPAIHVKYDSTRGYPNQHIKEEVMQQHQKDYGNNAINEDGNLVY